MTRAALAKSILERELSPEEFDNTVREALADEEDMKQVLELITWFTRRYPTVEDRLRYVSRHMKVQGPTFITEPHEDD